MADGDEASHTPSNDNQTLAQQRLDDRKSEDDKSKGKEKETGDTSKPKTDRVSFKTFRGSGAIEFFGKIDPLEALEWILNTEKVFRITRVLCDDKVNYATTMFKNRALIWWNATFAALGETEKEEQERVDHFIDGLRSEIRDVVANRDILEFEKAVESARRRKHNLTRLDRNPAPPAKRPRIEAYSLQSNAPPPCSTCGKAHQGLCNTVRPEVRCHGCGEVGHVRSNCPRRDMTCYSCGAIGHRQRECPRSKPAESKAYVHRPSTSGAPHQKEEVPRIQAKAFQITAEEARDKPDVVMADKVYKDCVLQLDEHEFFVDLVSMDIHSFDIIIGMDWLAKNRADILCFQRIIRIPNNVDYLYVYGEKRKGDVKKTVSDVSVVCEFPDVFPEDLPSLPPDRQVEFPIDLIPGAMLIARMLYHLAPAKMKEMKNQLQELLDKAFMDMMNRVCRPMLDKYVIVFIDDILVYSKSEADHVKHLCEMLETLRQERLYAKFSKCEFWLRQIHLIWILVSNSDLFNLIAPYLAESV
ncbi:uncharacterized protein LOC112499921 [Cynara cardunculus var. scolymus]|uniref:uncharacterized protein LOC112499921 n=1 Tax=Cynara cardunculus var. scolymus TaxID=59895 RepID=UPI000D62726D|nr:uncharacterized protein LOC112499921 [Cynara cardunculus var. scolymus]